MQASHRGEKGGGLHSKDHRSTFRTLDSPAGLLQRGDYVLVLRFLQRTDTLADSFYQHLHGVILDCFCSSQAFKFAILYNTQQLRLYFRSAKVSGMARIAPAGPSRKPQIMSESMICKRETCSPLTSRMP
jgi:hypothetical protein